MQYQNFGQYTLLFYVKRNNRFVCLDITQHVSRGNGVTYRKEAGFLHASWCTNILQYQIMHKFQANDFIKLTLLIKAYQSVNHKCWCIIVAFWHPTFLFVPFNYCSLSHCGWKSRHGHWDGCLKYKKIGTVNLTSEMVQQLFNNNIEWKYCGFQIIAAFNMNYNWQSIMRIF